MPASETRRKFRGPLRTPTFRCRLGAKLLLLGRADEAEERTRFKSGSTPREGNSVCSAFCSSCWRLQEPYRRRSNETLGYYRSGRNVTLDARNASGSTQPP